MIRQVSVLMFAVCVSSVAVAEGWGYSSDGSGRPDYTTCSAWRFPNGAPRSIFLYHWSNEAKQVRHGSHWDGKFFVKGYFMAGSSQIVGFWSKPDVETISPKFITPANQPISFSVEGSGKFNKSVTNGVVNRQDLPEQELYITTCPNNERDWSASEETEPARRIGDLNKEPPARPEPAKRISELTGDTAPPVSNEPPPTGGGSLKALARSVEKPPAPPPPLQVKPAGAKPSKTGLENSPVVKACHATDAFKPLAIVAGQELEAFQAVGMRNKEETARGYDFLAGAAIAHDQKYIIPGHEGELLLYEGVAPNEGAEDAQWVSVRGPEAAKPVSAIPAIKIVILGGAPEISVSGLDLVGRQIEKQSSGAVQVEAQWYAVDENGRIAQPIDFSSLQDLVSAASEKAGARRPDVLNEEQLLFLFNNFETMLKERPAPAHKIFWIKGSFPIPSIFPQRLEKFIASISSSHALVNSARNGPGKWFFVVTARMAGFSNNYLKAPIYDVNAGEVIEEANEGNPDRRSLIHNVDVLAAKLRTTLLSSPAVPAPPADAPEQKLVFNEREVFIQRGYITSPGAAAKLAEHLGLVFSLWNGDALEKDILGELTENGGKRNNSLRNVLESFHGETFPRLPKTLPLWARTPLEDFEKLRSESRKAKDFVERYYHGATRLANMLKASHESGSSACSLFYVPEESLGFASLDFAKPTTSGDAKNAP